ncbi:MAG: FAD:protein FMN transferase [Pirellulaceae bacterium]|nr:FAD:protein FMN transferase [Pirellulaceae bacterium]
MNRRSWLGTLAVGGWLLAGPSSLSTGAEEHETLLQFRRAEMHMGVEFEVILYAPSDAKGNIALDQAFARISELDKKLSDYDPSSELSRLSDTASMPPGSPFGEPLPKSTPIPLSNDLWKVLAFSDDLSRQSGGAFDVTAGPLTKLWRRARRQGELPAPERLTEARASVGYQHLRLDPDRRSAELLVGQMRLDLGGIAKGFAADEALAALGRQGISRALVRASGDVVVGNPPPGQKGWPVGIAPLDPNEPPRKIVRLRNRAISTSGDSRQHLVVGGRRYSHVIDPRTGRGVSGRSSTSVIARHGIEADSLATAISVLGIESGMKLVAKRPGVEAYLVFEEETGQQQTASTPGFEKLIDREMHATDD